tara:strand:+ start:605 stop:1327 length:723 start_codon:yes stop_codon:yes gene_type:complete
VQYPNLSVDLVAQVHHVKPQGIAHIDVYGCDDAVTRKAIRADAVRLLQQLGIHVELVGGHDVFTVSPDYSDPTTLQDYARRLQASATIGRDIELALLTDSTPAGWVYVDLEGITPRIIAHTEDKATYVAYTQRLIAILRALHRDLRASRMKSQHNTADFSDEQRAAARPTLQARLAECGCTDDEIEQLIGLSEEAETISEYAMRIMRDDPAPAARITKPRKRTPPFRSWPLPEDSDNNDD